MAKKKKVEEVEEVAPQVDPFEAKAEQIKSLFAELDGIEGIEIDESNPNHIVIAAWMVGRRGLLRF